MYYNFLGNKYRIILYIYLLYYNFLGDRLAIWDDRRDIFPVPPTVIFRGFGLSVVAFGIPAARIPESRNR